MDPISELLCMGLINACPSLDWTGFKCIMKTKYGS